MRSIEGQIIDANTQQAVRDLAGRKLAIRGQDSNGTRAVTMVDDEGRFRVDGLSVGTYIVAPAKPRQPA